MIVDNTTQKDPKDELIVEDLGTTFFNLKTKTTIASEASELISVVTKANIAKPKKSAVVVNYDRGNHLPIPSIMMHLAKMENISDQKLLNSTAE
jgi:hypothetical protein